ncbi:MAG: glycogen/starch/alpha-glucan phosphorylase, partial [Clostridia bacterium]
MRTPKTEEFVTLVTNKILSEYGCEPKMASSKQIYGAVCSVTNDILLAKRGEFLKQNNNYDGKKVYYFSMEFLQGASLRNNLYNLGLISQTSDFLKEFNLDLDDLCEIEPDAGLGNGGLGRLASCYMDGLATLGIPAEGFSIRYEFGIFKQEIVDGWQVEFPDNWLQNGSYWLEARPDEATEIHFGGFVEETWTENGLKAIHRNYDTIRAVPYDMMISGYESSCVNNLRLWRAQAPNNFDMSLFSRGEYVKSMENDAKAEAISKVLYPADNHYEGKMLRL